MADPSAPWSKTKELKKLSRELYYQNDEAYIELFYDYKHIDITFYENDVQAKNDFEKGEIAIAKNNIPELRVVISALYNLLKIKPKDYFEDQNGTLGLR